MFTLIYILACVLGFAVGIMLAWHLWTISIGETSVESHDHEVYRRYAKDRGQVSPANMLLSTSTDAQ